MSFALKERTWIQQEKGEVTKTCFLKVSGLCTSTQLLSKDSSHSALQGLSDRLAYCQHVTM